jgi:excisionase family DNA binding protein
MYVRGEGPSGKYVCQKCRWKLPCPVLEKKFLECLGSLVLGSKEVIDEIRDDPRAPEVARAIGDRQVSVAEAWPALDASERRQLVDVLVAQVVVDQEEIEVVLGISEGFQAEMEGPRANSLPSSHDLRVPRERATSESRSPDGGAVLLSVDEAAWLLRTTRRAVYVMVGRDVLPGVTRIGRRVLFRQEDLIRWLESRAPSPAEDRRW